MLNFLLSRGDSMTGISFIWAEMREIIHAKLTKEIIISTISIDAKSCVLCATNQGASLAKS